MTNVVEYYLIEKQPVNQVPSTELPNLIHTKVILLLPWSQRFSFTAKKEEKERSCERKPLVVGDENLNIMLR